MVIIPYKADVELYRVPFLTIIVCLVCLFIYFLQDKSDRDVAQFTYDYCAEQKTRILRHVFDKAVLDGKPVDCAQFLSTIATAPNKDEMLNSFIKSSRNFKSLSAESSKKLIRKELTQFYTNYSSRAPKDITVNYWYHPTNWSVPHMVTSAFAHGSWSHVLGNIFFFFAFAATIEIILGTILYVTFFLTIAGTTSVLYSLHSIALESTVPTLGLSGVVSGFMGVFMYLAPTINIRHALWFFMIFWRIFRFSIPVWLMVLFYIGFDTYKLITSQDWQGINLVAHVGGGIVGYLFGFLFLRSKKKMITDELRKRRWGN